jgi:hypothetical protein
MDELHVRFVALHFEVHGCVADRYGDQQSLGAAGKVIVYSR